MRSSARRQIDREITSPLRVIFCFFTRRRVCAETCEDDGDGRNTRSPTTGGNLMGDSPGAATHTELFHTRATKSVHFETGNLTKI